MSNIIYFFPMQLIKYDRLKLLNLYLNMDNIKLTQEEKISVIKLVKLRAETPEMRAQCDARLQELQVG